MSANTRVSQIDTLEPRLLLASFASLNANGILSVVGDPHSNDILIYYNHGKLRAFRDNSIRDFDVTKVKGIWAEGFGGNDQIYIAVPLPSTLIGDRGNDALVGNSKDDSIYGGSGDDILIGGGGNNLLDHGSGNDVYDYSSMQAGTFSLSDAGLTHPDGGTDVIATNRATILLTPGNDTFNVAGSASGDFLTNLIIDAGAGDDQLDFGATPNHSSIYSFLAGAGNDTISWDLEDAGITSVDGGLGDDVINQNDAEPNGPITADGGLGFDTYNLTFDAAFVGNNLDVTVPGRFEAFNTRSEGNLIVRGNGLGNVITATAANVTLYGNGGDDRLTLDTSDFNVHGGDPNTFGHGLLAGGSANDTLIGSPGTVFEGDSGNDTADFSSRTANLNITLDNLANDGAAGENSNVMADVEDVIGGSGNDRIIGSPSANNLIGNAGNDTLYGDAGNDTLDGGSGKDHLFAQDGDDLILAKDHRIDTLDGGNGIGHSAEGQQFNHQGFGAEHRILHLRTGDYHDFCDSNQSNRHA